MDISTHTLTWSVTEQNAMLSASRNFNSHAHVERDNGLTGTSKCFINFNSHAHVERDEAFDGFIDTVSISTHTLTWSVTHEFYTLFL